MGGPTGRPCWQGRGPPSISRLKAETGWQLHAAGERTDQPGLCLGHLVEGVLAGGEDEVLEHRDVIGVNDFLAELDSGNLELAAHGDGDGATTRGALEGGTLQLFLHLH